MRVARMIDSRGVTVLARLDGDSATPISFEEVQPRSDALVDCLASGVDIGELTPCGDPFAIESATWCSPVSWPSKIIAVGLNYADHAREAGFEIPASPMIFAKYPNSLIAHQQTICYRHSTSSQVDYEAELAVVIGRRVSNIGREDALGAVFGYTVCNDVSARDAQFADKQFTRGKSFDTFCPLGPWVVTADEIPDPQALAIRARVNGTIVQDSNTSEMIFPIAEVISYLSRVMTLEPGDVIATGTPAGVGMAKQPPLYLLDGDVVEVEVEGVGLLTNPVQQL
jgi:2-keto-4-pentenoate hydratase/2-oxohepta-3-ene-1,7-dioic acid hydratase in catechol pathway